jgi:glycerophosphoryl diester phosphodiesterase
MLQRERTPIAYAVRNEDVECAALLLQRGVDVTVTDNVKLRILPF